MHKIKYFIILLLIISYFTLFTRAVSAQYIDDPGWDSPTITPTPAETPTPTPAETPTPTPAETPTPPGDRLLAEYPASGYTDVVIINGQLTTIFVIVTNVQGSSADFLVEGNEPVYQGTGGHFVPIVRVVGENQATITDEHGNVLATNIPATFNRDSRIVPDTTALPANHVLHGVTINQPVGLQQTTMDSTERHSIHFVENIAANNLIGHPTGGAVHNIAPHAQVTGAEATAILLRKMGQDVATWQHAIIRADGAMIAAGINIVGRSSETTRELTAEEINGLAAALGSDFRITDMNRYVQRRDFFPSTITPAFRIVPPPPPTPCNDPNNPACIGPTPCDDPNNPDCRPTQTPITFCEEHPTHPSCIEPIIVPPFCERYPAHQNCQAPDEVSNDEPVIALPFCVINPNHENCQVESDPVPLCIAYPDHPSCQGGSLCVVDPSHPTCQVYYSPVPLCVINPNHLDCVQPPFCAIDPSHPSCQIEPTEFVPIVVPRCLYFRTTRPSILYRQSTRLEWSCIHVDDCFISPNIGPVRPSYFRNISPNNTTTYTLTCRYGSQLIHHTTTLRVFTPELREIPAFYRGLMRIAENIIRN